MKEAITKADAEACLKLIERHYAAFIEPGYGPALVWGWEKTWDSPAPVIPCAIVWADGPGAWAVNASHHDVIPREIAYAEPASEWVLGLYPA